MWFFSRSKEESEKERAIREKELEEARKANRLREQQIAQKDKQIENLKKIAKAYEPTWESFGYPNEEDKKEKGDLGGKEDE